MGEGNIRIQESPEKNKMLASLDRAGARVPYRCEYYPSMASQQSDKYEQLGVKYSNIDQTFKTGTFRTFDDWFSSWVEDSIIVPDTCIIIEHYLNEVILPRLRGEYPIRIPRFVILELEAKARRFQDKVERNKEEKRLVFSAFNEIRRLRLNFDALPFPNPVRADLQAQFSQLAGSGIIDSLIRTEMWDHRKRFKSMILITRDLLMASTASAEDIDAFYFCPANPEKTEFEVTNFPEIIRETAITFDKIRVVGLWDDHDLLIEGMWSGKDIMDWGNNRLRMQLHAQ
ncbi:MAG: PIN domain-containing protein [Candidatus Bathyarchaeota archaeon]|nr:PIN domain-containing protein [Candidatus Bathyarchaeota archaeon]